MISKRRLKDRRRWIRRAISCWLVFHLIAITLAPAAVPPTSPLFQDGWLVVRPYLQTLYLNHGYHFFAPEPAFSTMVDYRVSLKDGRVIEAQLPNKQIWPRLLYHRHFMLTEYLGFFDVQGQIELRDSYVGHLKHKYDATEVSVEPFRHMLPTMEFMQSPEADAWHPALVEDVDLTLPEPNEDESSEVGPGEWEDDVTVDEQTVAGTQ